MYLVLFPCIGKHALIDIKIKLTRNYKHIQRIQRMNSKFMHMERCMPDVHFTINQIGI